MTELTAFEFIKAIETGESNDRHGNKVHFDTIKSTGKPDTYNIKNVIVNDNVIIDGRKFSNGFWCSGSQLKDIEIYNCSFKNSILFNDIQITGLFHISGTKIQGGLNIINTTILNRIWVDNSNIKESISFMKLTSGEYLWITGF